MSTAKLVQIDGDKVLHLAPGQTDVVDSPAVPGGDTDDVNVDPNEGKALDDVASEKAPTEHKGVLSAKSPSDSSTAPKAVFNVQVTLDSSLDIEKLQKQLELLKRFGAI